MFDLGNLGDGVGKLYVKLKSGAINTLDNTPSIAMALMNNANKSRIIYAKYTLETGGSFTDQFQDAEYGSRYYLNADVSAPIGDITGAIEVTKYFIAPTKCYKDDVTIDVDDEVTIIRYSFIHVVLLNPATGTEDTLNYLNHDLQPGDLVIFALSDESTDTITINPYTVSDGNFKCQNDRAIILSGAGSTAIFVRDGSNGQAAGGKGFLREIGRPDENALQVATKNLTSGGGAYYCLDISTPDAARIDSKRGLVVLRGGATLNTDWDIYGEIVDSARSEGTTLEFILDSPLYTDSLTGGTLNIFGIRIPDIYCASYNFVVKAWFNNVDSVWEARMYVDQLKLDGNFIDVMNDGSDSGDTPYSIQYSSKITAGSAKATKTISHLEGSEGLVSFSGTFVVTDTFAANNFDTLSYNIINSWRPNTTATTNFICPVIRGGTIPITYVMIQIADSITIYVGATALLAGDAIYISNIIYPSYNYEW